MTYIEFFDKIAVDNICACLVSPPERVVLVGSALKTLQKHAARYSALLSARGHQVEFVCRSVNKNNLTAVLQTLEELVLTYKDCAFDLTGGEESYLVAVGILCERYREMGIQLHRLNIRSGSIVDFDRDGNVIEGEQPALTVAENISLYGGKLVGADEKECGTYPWRMDEEFCADIDRMWEICRRDTGAWNKQMTFFSVLEELRAAESDGRKTVTYTAALTERNEKTVQRVRVLEPLARAGLCYCEYGEDKITVCYKNEQVKRCLTKAGQVLEMSVYAAARAASENGKPFYNDAVNGAYIDWDGNVHADRAARDTENEIDVLLMHGAVPIFISCKNGYVEMEELYKLQTVAERFGGQYAKCVLVTTALNSMGSYGEYIRQRAQDMHIRVVDDWQTLEDKEAHLRAVKDFCLP